MQLLKVLKPPLEHKHKFPRNPIIMKIMTVRRLPPYSPWTFERESKARFLRLQTGTPLAVGCTLRLQHLYPNGINKSAILSKKYKTVNVGKC